MANFDYSPDQREFYELDTKFGNLSMIMGGGIRSRDEREDAFIYRSGQNYRAFAASRLPWEASSEETINKIIDLFPALKVDEKQQEERRRMSEQARNAILDAAVRKVMATNGRKLNMRLDYALLLRGDDDETKELNDQREQQLKGTPAERGRLLEERVRESVDLYRRILNGEVSNQELIANFEEIHKVQDLVMNAQHFVPAALPNPETGDIYYQISDETLETLRDMERRANEISMFITKIRQIANPNYEFLDLEIIRDMPQDAIDELTDRAAPEEDDYVFDDIIDIGNEIKGYKDNVLCDNLMKQFAKDFPAEVETAKLQFAGSDGEVKTTKCVYDSHDNTIQRCMEEGYALVTTPSGDAACYHVDKQGRVTSAIAADMLNNTTPDTQGMLKKMRDANKGFFIGSKEYSSALKNMEKAFTTVQKLGNPPSPEKMDKAASYYMAVLEEAEKYIEKKMSRPPTPDEQAILDQLENPEDRVLDIDDIRNAMSPREKLRFDTMKQVATFCKKQLSLLTLQSEAAAAEKKAVMDFHRINKNVAYPKVDRETVSTRVYFDYTAEHLDWDHNMEPVSNVIPASDVGNIADELRANLEKRLEKMVLDSEPDEAHWLMSDMVVLELVKMGRTTDANGNHLAGDLEKKLAENPGNVISAFRKDPYIMSMTRDVDVDKLRAFVMNKGAKTIAEHMTKMAMKQTEAAEQAKVKNEAQNEVQNNVPTNALQ